MKCDCANPISLQSLHRSSTSFDRWQFRSNLGGFVLLFSPIRNLSKYIEHLRNSGVCRKPETKEGTRVEKKEMEDEAAGAMKSTQRKRCLKPQPLFNNYHSWKYKLRENCYKRVREDRRRLLWKMRMLPTPQTLNYVPNEEFIKSAFQDIVSAEFEKLKDSSLNDNIGNDVLWEYDDVKTAYQGDCEDILLEMQTIFYEDLSREPTRKGAENRVETWEDEEDEYLAQAVSDHMQLNDKKEKAWCPICKHGQLQETYHLIYCSQCELQLNKGNEVSLELLRVRLAEVHLEHLDGGCRLKPKFCIETRFDITALYILCSGCSTFEIVL